MSSQDNVAEAIKVANIEISTTYPIISAWEFEFLKGEDMVRERFDRSTIYLILQRPFTFFDNVTFVNQWLFFEIADGSASPLRCRLDLSSLNFFGAEENINVSVEYFRKNPDSKQPFRNVAAIRIFKETGEFVLWWSPQKILYEMLCNNLPVEVSDDGDPLSFLDFKVHYIGKAFSQKVWDRLTGHEKMQRLVTTQQPVGVGGEAHAPFEIGLLILTVSSFSEDFEVLVDGKSFLLSGLTNVTPIKHHLDLGEETAFEEFITTPLVQFDDAAITTEVEAMLIKHFQPEENEIKFLNYPEIKGGMRSKGYSATNLWMKTMPVKLYTDHYVKNHNDR